MDGQAPTLSIVIAACNAATTIAECLASVQRQVDDQAGIDVVVVDGSTDGTADQVAESFPSVRLIRCPQGTLIPELWSAGIFASRGEIIAITTAHAVPDEHWVQEILRAHQSDYGAVGGAIECMDAATWVDWAVYFCRYTEYMRPFPARPVAEVAADNASYKRVALRGCEGLMREGFWEPFIHAEMRKNGFGLFIQPAIVVYHGRSFGFLSFMRQRYQHGCHFGWMRAGRLSPAQRAKMIWLSPAIPALLLGRMARRVWVKKRNRLKFLWSLPVLTFFVLSWSAGEVMGYRASPPSR